LYPPRGAKQIWCYDITYIRTGEGFGYLCVIKDLYDEKIVGWSFRRHMKTELEKEDPAGSEQLKGC